MMKDILRRLFTAVIGFTGGVIFMIYRCGYILEGKQKKLNKYFTYYKFLDSWLSWKENNNNYAEYFNENSIETVAIYGMGRIGKRLKNELENAGIKIAYVIDEGETIIYSKEIHYNLRDILPAVDLIIVTPIDEFEEIRNRILDNNKTMNVISVDKIIGWNKSGIEKGAAI